MEDQAATLLATLRRTSASMDAKLQLFNTLKSAIKHQRVSDAAQSPIFECIRLAISSHTSTTLVSTGFATLGHLIKRLNLQDQANVTAAQVPKLTPILLERLGDARENHRVAASQALADLWSCDRADVETVIRDGALAGSSSRARDMAMRWVVQMHKTEGLPFKSFVPFLVGSLEDADGVTRETAKSAVIDLFRSAPDHAKADLKKQMNSRGVRKTIVNHIVSQLGFGEPEAADLKASAASAPLPSSSNLNPDRGIADSIMSMPDALPPPTVETAPMDPLYYHSAREVDEVFREMQHHFEGRESEGNWMARDKSVLKLRRMNKGNAPTDFTNNYYSGIKTSLDGILKVANSLRTTMSTNGCQLVQEVSRTLGTLLDPQAEILLQNFIKMCAAVKNIAAQNGNVTVDAVLLSVSYNHRIMGHLIAAASDKNVQPRIFAAGWLRSVIKKHTSHQSNIDHSGGTESIDKCIRKGLGDANPKVRESMRETYWAFAQAWPDRGEAILESLDAKPRSLLEKDPNNPNASSRTAALSRSTSAVSQARPSVKGAIAAQRKAQLAAARKLPERPNSAQSAFSPMRSPSALATRAPSVLSQASRPASSAATRPNLASSAASSSNNGGSALMSAPVRRPRRPELARPATADPYASRKMPRPMTPTMSPGESPARTTTAKKPSTMKGAVRPRSQRGASPGQSPARSEVKPASTGRSAMSRSESHAERDAFSKSTTSVSSAPSHPSRPNIQKVASPSADSSMADMVDEDNFTMVIPAMSLQPSLGALESATAGEPLNDERQQSPKERAAVSGGGGGDDENGVKVYEDPFVGDEHQQQQRPQSSGIDKPVLEELPVNERHTGGSNSDVDAVSNFQGHRHNKSTSSGSIASNPHASQNPSQQQDRSEVLRSRRLLASGTERVRAKTLDAHGFRRLQEIVKSRNGAIWANSEAADSMLASSTPGGSAVNSSAAGTIGTGEKRFAALLTALLEYLEAPLESLKSPTAGATSTPSTAAAFSSNATLKATNLKTQALATTRAMLALGPGSVPGHRSHPSSASASHHSRRANTNNTSIGPFLPRALCSVARARSRHESTAHITAELDRTAEEIVRAAEALGREGACIDALLDLLEPVVSASNPTTTTKDAAVETRARLTEAALSALATLLRLSLPPSSTSPSAPSPVKPTAAASADSAALLPSSRTRRLRPLLVTVLDDRRPEVRKAGTEVCIELHDRMGEAAFWALMVDDGRHGGGDDVDDCDDDLLDDDEDDDDDDNDDGSARARRGKNGGNRGKGLNDARASLVAYYVAKRRGVGAAATAAAAAAAAP